MFAALACDTAVERTAEAKPTRWCVAPPGDEARQTPGHGQVRHRAFGGSRQRPGRD